MIQPQNVEGKKKKTTSSKGRQSSAKYALRHGYTPKSNPRRRGGKWVAGRNKKG